MRKLAFILFIFCTILSCNKKTEKLNGIDVIKSLTNLKSYNISKKSINDTLFQFSGFNKNYSITGYINGKNNKRYKWWRVNNRKNNERILDIEYVNVGRKVFTNQILFYKNNKIDTLVSTFYTVKNQNQNLLYRFYTPKNSQDPDEIKSHFLYIMSKNNKIISQSELFCKQKGNFFECEIENPGNDISILGFYSEKEINEKNKSIGISEIYVSDTIK